MNPSTMLSPPPGITPMTTHLTTPYLAASYEPSTFYSASSPPPYSVMVIAHEAHLRWVPTNSCYVALIASRCSASRWRFRVAKQTPVEGPRTLQPKYVDRLTCHRSGREQGPPLFSRLAKGPKGSVAIFAFLRVSWSGWGGLPRLPFPSLARGNSQPFL